MHLQGPVLRGRESVLVAIGELVSAVSWAQPLLCCAAHPGRAFLQWVHRLGWGGGTGTSTRVPLQRSPDSPGICPSAPSSACRRNKVQKRERKPKTLQRNGAQVPENNFQGAPARPASPSSCWSRLSLPPGPVSCRSPRMERRAALFTTKPFPLQTSLWRNLMASCCHCRDGLTSSIRGICHV